MTNKMIENFHERMQRVLLFEPLYRLARRSIKTKEGTVVSYMEFGLMALLFFFENMLSRKRKASVRDLAIFFKEATAGNPDLAEEEFEKIAREIVAVFRPPTGKRNEVEFFNWETKLSDKVQYSYLKAQRADIAANEQYYVLAEQGLELIFATKEYFSEFQLSINQLILRKQLEKGEFVLALRQIDEMRLDVETLKEQIMRTSNEIHRNIVSDDTLLRYRKIIDDINVRLKIEEKEFLELKDFIIETREKFIANVERGIEEKVYENILLVEQNLDEVHTKHRKLLQNCIDIENVAMRAAEDALYFSGIGGFNFEHEVSDRLFASPLPLHTTQVLVKPFLPIEQVKVWSPLAVFMPQRLDREREKIEPQAFLACEETVENRQGLINLQENYVHIVKLLLLAMETKRKLKLAEFIAFMEQQGETELMQAKQFYLFWMILHRKRCLNFAVQEVGEKSAFYQIGKKIPELKSIRVEEKNKILHLNDRFSISDMTICVEVE